MEKQETLFAKDLTLKLDPNSNYKDFSGKEIDYSK